MSLPLISIIVPVYKVEKYLNQCVESIVRQTYQNLEIILIEDGSPDACPSMCDEWAKKDNRIKVIHRENGGVSSARNAGLNAATGEYIGFVDSDDMISDDFYEFLLNNLIEHQADISRCAHYYFDDSGFVSNCDEIVDEVFCIDGKEHIMVDISKSGNKSVVLWNKLFKADLLKGLRFDRSFVVGEDTLFLFNAYKYASRLVCYDLPKYGYNIHDERSWSRNDYNFQASRAMKKIIDDPECPVAVYRKYFTFATMALHDIVINGYSYDFNDLRREILHYMNKIKKALVGDQKSLIKLYLLKISPAVYKYLLKRN